MNAAKNLPKTFKGRAKFLFKEQSDDFTNEFNDKRRDESCPYFSRSLISMLDINDYNFISISD
jgi:hypothetical protein